MTSLVRLAGYSYSGRGMMGKRCLAFGSLDVLLAAVRADHTLPLNGWQLDAMGKGVVYYNPAVPPSIQAGGPTNDPDDDDYSEPLTIKKCCLDPMVRGGKCYNCGQWIDDDMD